MLSEYQDKLIMQLKVKNGNDLVGLFIPYIFVFFPKRNKSIAKNTTDISKFLYTI